jgi:hypothetical protein
MLARLETRRDRNRLPDGREWWLGVMSLEAAHELETEREAVGNALRSTASGRSARLDRREAE